MTESEAHKTIRVKENHIGGHLEASIIRYACPGGFAVVVPVPDHPDLWYILTGYDVNIFEDLGAAAAAPPIVRLFPDTIAFFRLPSISTAFQAASAQNADSIPNS